MYAFHLSIHISFRCILSILYRVHNLCGYTFSFVWSYIFHLGVHFLLGIDFIFVYTIFIWVYIHTITSHFFSGEDSWAGIEIACTSLVAIAKLIKIKGH